MSKPTQHYLTTGAATQQPKKIKDQPGEFAMIDKNELRVDQQYQRRHSEDKVNQMAASWSWIACGAISVALRDDAEWFVMDGQHRVLAAQKVPAIQKLPCLVFDVDSVAQEAKGFLDTNTRRKPMSMVDRVKALLMTEDHTARVINELVLSSGRTISNGAGPQHFTAVQIMMSCVRIDEHATRRVWPVITALCNNDQTPEHRINQPLISGMWYLERHMHTDSLAASRWKKRILQVGYAAIQSSMQSSANFYGGGLGIKNCALGIVQAINRGLRNKLEHTIKTQEDTTEEDVLKPKIL